MDEIKPLSLLVVLGIVLDLSGALHVFGFGDAATLTREATLATLLLLVALVWILRRPSAADVPPARTVLLVAALPLIAAIFSISDVLTYVARGWSPARLLIFGVGTVSLLVLALRRAHGAAFAAVALLLGIAIRYIHIKYLPLEPTRGDMLPLVQQALGNFFQGASPYTTYRMPWELPLTYLPLTWLAYAPAYLIGIDLRWTNLLAELGLLGAVLFLARAGRGAERRVAPHYALLLWAWIFLSPTIVHWDMVTSAPIGWVVLAWTLALAAAGPPFAAALAAGIAAATTPLIAVVLPLLALNWWRGYRLVGLLRFGGVTVLVAATLLLPWLAWSPDAFLEGNLRWFNDLDRFPRMKWRTEHTWATITGFSGFFWEWGREAWLKPIQALGVGLIALVYLLRGASQSDLPRHATAAYIVFTLFNPVLWPYLYNPALVAGWLAVVAIGLPAVAAAPIRDPIPEPPRWATGDTELQQTPYKPSKQA
jgi:hypothetical protein